MPRTYSWSGALLMAVTALVTAPDSVFAQGVATGSTAAPTIQKVGEEKPRYTMDDRERFKHRTAQNDELYDAVSNLDAPPSNKTVPWLVGLTLGGAIGALGLKHSFRNRFEG